MLVGPIPGGSSDVALYADVAPLTDNHFDCCDLLQRSVVHYGACKVLATIENQHMSGERNERMWNLAYRLARAGSIKITRLSNGNCRRMGIPKRANYCTTHESAQGWMPYAPRPRGLRPRLLILTASLRALTIISTRPAQLKNNGAS